MLAYCDRMATTNTVPRVDSLLINSPKRRAAPSSEDRLFPYYAGYSLSFAQSLLGSAELKATDVVLDPWNGSGTTIHAAHQLGVSSIGVDLNPVMGIVAKARLLSSAERSSLRPLAQSIVEEGRLDSLSEDCDPLNSWIAPPNLGPVRSIEASIHHTLVSHGPYIRLDNSEALDRLAPIAAFFYVALFRALRRLLQDFFPSNPTWVKRPRMRQARKRPSNELILRLFLGEVEALSASLWTSTNGIADRPPTKVLVGSSKSLPLPKESVDFVLTSPPYCTRIDYAVATSIELAALRFSDAKFDRLRRSLMGTSTVRRTRRSHPEEWGLTASQFLKSLLKHESKASKTYYYKNHVSYFDSLFRSLGELHRVTKPRGRCVLIVQNSHYKEIYNDVPRIVEEMADASGFRLARRQDFSADRSMVLLNKRAKKYLDRRKQVECVLCFEKL